MFVQHKNKGNFNLAFVECFADMTDSFKQDYVYRKTWTERSWFGLKKTIYAAGYYFFDWFDRTYVWATKEQAVYGNVVRVWFIGNRVAQDFEFDSPQEVRDFILSIKNSKISNL